MLRRIALFLVIVSSLCTSAIAQDEVYTGTLSGTILDTRTAAMPVPGQYSEDDEYNYTRALDMGPFYVLIADGTNRVHPLYSYGSTFFGTDAVDPDPNVEYLAPYVNQRVRVSGEINTAPQWPSVSHITNIESA